MQIAFRCPRCEKISRASLPADTADRDTADRDTADRDTAGRDTADRDTAQINCEHCQAVLRIPDDALEPNRLNRCLICGSDDLFTRKDFPQRLGVAVVVFGFIASSIAWYRYQIFLAFGILFTTAAIDVILYLLVADALVCYCCGAHYRRAGDLSDHGAFNLETHERYRQTAARLERAGGSSANLESRHGADSMEDPDLSGTDS